MKLFTTTGIIIFENDKPTLKETIFDAINSGIKNMDNINLSNQTLTGIDLSGISLNGAYFKGASITDSKFQGCVFEWADFTYSTFKDCDLSKSEFINTYFNEVSFLNCDFKNSKIKNQVCSMETEGSIFNGCDMTGLQMSNAHFLRSDFGGVLMRQSVLNWVSFEGCHVSGMTIGQSILHSFQANISNFGNIDTTGIIAEGVCEINGWAKTGLEFLPEPFIIAPENKITVYRVNIGDLSPCTTGNVWDYDSKAVKTKSGFGIYGYTIDMSGCRSISIGELWLNVRDKMSNTIDRSRMSRVILELEVDKRKVLHKGGNEIAFSECNIMGLVTPKDFILQNYPQCTELLDLYDKAMDNPDLYGPKYIQEEQEQLRSLTIKPNSSDLQIRASQLEIIKEYAINNSKPSDIHGLSHWQNVERNAALLAEKTGADLQILRSFAYFHDMCRENDGSDPDHGLRASKLVKEYAGSLLHDMEDSKVYKLLFACANHTKMLRTGDLTINACFDADRLDLTRIGITPDPEKMATDVGAYYAANPEIFKAEIKRCVSDFFSFREQNKPL